MPTDNRVLLAEEVLHTGWSTSGSCTSGRCALSSSCRRESARTACAARRGTCSRRSTRRTCSSCRSPRGSRRRPRTCSDVPLRHVRWRRTPSPHRPLHRETARIVSAASTPG